MWTQFLKKLLTKKQTESTQSWTIIQTTVRPLSLQHFTFGSVENVVKSFLNELSYFHSTESSIDILSEFETPNSMFLK